MEVRFVQSLVFCGGSSCSIFSFLWGIVLFNLYFFVGVRFVQSLSFFVGGRVVQSLVLYVALC